MIASTGRTQLGGEDFECTQRESCIAGPNVRTCSEIAYYDESKEAEWELSVDAIIAYLSGQTVTNESLEKHKAKLLKSILKPVVQVLDSVRTMMSEITDVVVVGGSARNPVMQQLLTDYFDG